MVDPELGLLIDCARHHFGTVGTGALRERLRAADGERLTTLARQHGLERLVWRSLRASALVLPGTVPLAAFAERQADEGRRLAFEAGRIHRTLAASSLPHLFPGGPALAQQVWGEPLALRGDLDLLVAPSAIPKAARLLTALSYVQEEPDPSVDTADWHRRWARSRWRSDDGVLLSLRNRLADQRGVLDRLTGTALPIHVGTAPAIPALPPGVQLSVLAMEGAMEAWHRLDRLATFAALVRQLDPAMLERALETSARLETERPLAAALILASRLFGTGLPDQLWVDGGSARLVRIGIAELSAPAPLPTRRLGVLRLVHARALLKPGSRFFLGSLLRQLGGALLR